MTMTFQLLPYNKNRKGSDEAPIIYEGILHTTYRLLVTTIILYYPRIETVQIERCQQLCIPCKTCKGQSRAKKSFKKHRELRKFDKHTTCEDPCLSNDRSDRLCLECATESVTPLLDKSCHCSDGLEVYTSSKCAPCGGEGGYYDNGEDGGTTWYDCEDCNGTGKIDHTAEIVEALKLIERGRYLALGNETLEEASTMINHNAKLTEAQARLTELLTKIK